MYQHPGGIIVIPDYMDVAPTLRQFNTRQMIWALSGEQPTLTSIQFTIMPQNSIFWHDDLIDSYVTRLSGMDPKSIPPWWSRSDEIFGGTEVLGVTPEQTDSNTDTWYSGIWYEIRSWNVRTNKTFQHSLNYFKFLGLSHGTDVYLEIWKN